MSRFPLRILLAVAGAHLLLACASPRIAEGRADSDFTLAQVRESKTLFTASGDVRIKEFRQSYQDAFGSGDSLTNRISSQAVDSLARAGLKISRDASLNRAFAALEEGIPTPEEMAALRDKISGADAKYILRIKNVVVSNAFETTAGMPGATVAKMSPSGKVTYGHNAGAPAVSQESCVIQYEVDVWETATLKKKATFSVSAEKKVPFFAYQAALISAVDASSRYLVQYLLTNQTKFL